MVGFYSEGRHDVLDVEMGMNISSFQRSITKKYWGEPMDELTTKSIVEDTKTMYPEVEFVRVSTDPMDDSIKLTLEFRTPEDRTWFILKWA